MQIIQRIVGRVGRRIDEPAPMVDARLPDGSRINAMIPPLGLQRADAFDSPLRPPRRWTSSELLANGSICPEMVDLARGGHRGPDQRHDLRRHRRRQDDAAQRPVALHSRPTSGW